jgi:hypothetical protein
MSTQFMETRNPSNVICAVFLLSSLQTLKDTLNVFMKNSNNINALFVKRALALKVHSNCTLKRCMPTKSRSNVICVIILPSTMHIEKTHRKCP